MTHYEKELCKIQNTVYANTQQIKAVIGIRKFIETNYDEAINLEVLSKTQSISKFHLIRLFKKYYGQTPRQYLIDKRLEASKAKLKTGISVTETCFAVGFESLGSFSTLFKSKIGKTPSDYQIEQLSRSRIHSEY